MHAVEDPGEAREDGEEDPGQEEGCSIQPSHTRHPSSYSGTQI